MEQLLTQPEKVDLIVNRGLEYFGITLEETLERSPKNKSDYFRYKHPNWAKRRLVAYALHSIAFLTPTEIRDKLGFRQHATIIYHIGRMQEELGETKGVANRTTKALYRDMLKYIGL